jgi:hypothetical protein
VNKNTLTNVMDRKYIADMVVHLQSLLNNTPDEPAHVLATQLDRLAMQAIEAAVTLRKTQHG